MYHWQMLSHDQPESFHREAPPVDWIDQLTDEQCMEVFWLYVDPPEPFLQRYPPALLGQALRYALRAVAKSRGAKHPA
jgi:hypothetical protein